MVGDNIIGLITAKHGEFYKVDVGSSQSATLSHLAFEGATKRNRPNLQIGNLVYCKVTVAGRDIEPEVSCVSESLKAEGMGELKNGFLVNVSCSFARRLSLLSNNFLGEIGKMIPFEIVIGMNGRVWINSSSVRATIILCNAIRKANSLPFSQQHSFIKTSAKSILDSK